MQLNDQSYDVSNKCWFSFISVIEEFNAIGIIHSCDVTKYDSRSINPSNAEATFVQSI